MTKVRLIDEENPTASTIVKTEIVSYTLKYYLPYASDAGVNEHPQLHMVSLGYELLKSLPESMGDCWFFEVPKIFEPLPRYLEISDFDL